MRARISLAAAVAACLAAPALAQNGGENEIIVTGERAREIAQAFAEHAAVAPTASDQYARWNARLCPGVVGLEPSDAQVLIDQIAYRADQVGLQVERSGCRANLVILFAQDSDMLARELRETRPDLLGYYSQDDTVTAGRAALEDFVNTPRAVRWWHISQTVSADGRPLGDTNSRSGRSTASAVAAARGNAQEAATTGSGFSGVDSVRSSGTRTRRDTRQDLNYALIIVDGHRIAGIPSTAVADYVAMAALAPLDPDADMTGFPSILNLFADDAADRIGEPEMSEWDIAYLRGLYSATREANNAHQQRREIARQMVEQITQ